MIKLNPGDKAPYFEGITGEGNMLKLDDFKGRKLILYFYPKDNTPGCTAEACSLRDGKTELRKMGFDIVGVSPDSQKSHIDFAAKNSLNFPLISDPDKKIAEAYGVWGEKKMAGRTYMGIIRKTFIIDENGVIEKVFDKVETKDHFGQILRSYQKH